MKKCIECGEEKEATIEFFTKSKTNKDGFQGKCKACKREYWKQYYKENSDKIKANTKAYRDANPEKVKTTNKAWIQANPNKEKARHKAYREANTKKVKARDKAYNKVYRDANPEREKARSKEYREANPDKMKAYDKEWAKANPEKCRQIGQLRRARKRALPCTFTLEQWEETTQYFNNCCAYCGEEKPLAQEHFIALSKGGEYSHKNIVCACKSCNSSKNAKAFSVWYPQQTFYSKKREKSILSYLGYKHNVQQLALI